MWRALKVLVVVPVSIVFLWLVATSSIHGQVMAVALLALVLWSLYPNLHLPSSILVIVLLAVFQVSFSPAEFFQSLLSTYGESGLWIIISGFILSEGMRTSGLARRIALWAVMALGGDPDRIFLSVGLANLAVAPIFPSTTAKAFLLLPICAGLIEAFAVEKGRNRYGAGVMIMSMAANNICSTGFLTATVPNPISASYIREAANIDLGWFEWFKMSFPVTLILLASSWLVCRRFFRPEIRESSEALKRIEDLRGRLGPLSRAEASVALLFSISLLLWVTEGLHGLNSGLISLALSLLLFLPWMGVMKVGGFVGGVPWGSIALFAASMFLANAVGRWRALDPVAFSIFRVFDLSILSLPVYLAVIIFVAMFLHVAFTSTTVYATVVVPLSISLARLQGLEPQLVAVPVAFLTPIALILPVNTIPNIVFYSSGYFNQRQMMLYGVVMSIVSAFLILTVGLPYWRLLGLVRF
jgi:anion transporter